MDEYYDYVADPVWGVYHPQEFKEVLVIIKCDVHFIRRDCRELNL